MSMREKWGWCHACCCSGETNLDTECRDDQSRLHHEAQLWLDTQGRGQDMDLCKDLADFATFVVERNKRRW